MYQEAPIGASPANTTTGALPRAAIASAVMTWAARHRANPDLTSSAGVGIGHRHAAMLVARMDQADFVVVGHRRRPIHVGVTHQGEERVDPLGGEGLGQEIRNLVIAHCASLFPKKTCRSHETKARHKILLPLSSESAGVTA